MMSIEDKNAETFKTGKSCKNVSELKKWQANQVKSKSSFIEN